MRERRVWGTGRRSLQIRSDTERKVTSTLILTPFHPPWSECLHLLPDVSLCRHSIDGTGHGNESDKGNGPHTGEGTGRIPSPQFTGSSGYSSRWRGYLGRGYEVMSMSEGGSRGIAKGPGGEMGTCY